MDQERLDRAALDDKARTSAPRERVGSKPGPGKGPGAADVRTNDFALKLANVNGTGSASANGLLMQAIFRMGIPVSGKNLFPSNIQGLPTWYTIRASKDGFIARRRDVGVLICMNPETAH